tara:strand:- start:1061 stop:1345 length:285 start_codon:yes stop_codon:yes gene_type:complete
MPTDRKDFAYIEGYGDGYRKGYRDAKEEFSDGPGLGFRGSYNPQIINKPKRKLSAWQKFVKANSKKPRFRYKSGAKKGKLNLKAMGVAYRKKKR